MKQKTNRAKPAAYLRVDNTGIVRSCWVKRSLGTTHKPLDGTLVGFSALQCFTSLLTRYKRWDGIEVVKLYVGNAGKRSLLCADLSYEQIISCLTAVACVVKCKLRIHASYTSITIYGLDA